MSTAVLAVVVLFAVCAVNGVAFGLIAHAKTRAKRRRPLGKVYVLHEPQEPQPHEPRRAA